MNYDNFIHLHHLQKIKDPAFTLNAKQKIHIMVFFIQYM